MHKLCYCFAACICCLILLKTMIDNREGSMNCFPVVHHMLKCITTHTEYLALCWPFKWWRTCRMTGLTSWWEPFEWSYLSAIIFGLSKAARVMMMVRYILCGQGCHVGGNPGWFRGPRAGTGPSQRSKCCQWAAVRWTKISSLLLGTPGSLSHLNLDSVQHNSSH